MSPQKQNNEKDEEKQYDYYGISQTGNDNSKHNTEAHSTK